MYKYLIFSNFANKCNVHNTNALHIDLKLNKQYKDENSNRRRKRSGRTGVPSRP